MQGVVRHLRRAALLSEGGPTDAQLLERFLALRDGAAFEGLLRRHAAMVWGVCRRVLGEHDAEDAFQATFLVLVRKAASVRPREAVGNWLYGVAYRTALKARAMNARRRTKEREGGVAARPQPPTDAAAEELLERLDAELSRLPDRYREPVVLCDLEGGSRKEVARQLGIPEGTLSSRLATARKLLARRLGRNGPALSGGGLAALLAERAAAAGVPGPLLASTARLAAGTVPASVLTLTEGVMKAMLLCKLKVVCAMALVLLVSAGAVGLTYLPARAAPQKPARTAPDELDVLRLEIEALRKDLQAVRERVKILEAQTKDQKTGAAPGFGTRGTSVAYPGGYLGDRINRTLDGGSLFLGGMKRAGPLDEARKALEKLRKDPGNKQALATLEKALKLLKERETKEDPKPSKP